MTDSEIQKRGESFPSWWNLLPLVLGAFVVAVEGTILTGVLPNLSRDLHASSSLTGQALTIYPLVYVVGAPALAVLGSGFSQQRVCRAGLWVFALGNLITAAAPSVYVLMAGRLVAAIGACAYTPNAGARAVNLGMRRRGRALAILASGANLATILGAPAGIQVAGLIGWRYVLVGIAGLALVVGLTQSLSRLGNEEVAAMGMRHRLRFLKDRQLLEIVVLTLVVVAAEFIVYSYVALLVGHNVGGGREAVQTAMMLFGIGTMSGTLLGGFGVDRFGWSRMLRVSMAMIAASLMLIPFAHQLTLLSACLIVWGLFGWTFTPSQINRMFAVFPENGSLLLTLNGSAVFIGVALGGIIGGFTIDLLGIGALPIVASAVVWVSLAVLTLSMRLAGGPSEAYRQTSPAGASEAVLVEHEA